MNEPPRIAMIHATRVAMEPIEAALVRLWPEAMGISLLDESLSADSGPGGVAQTELDRRIGTLCRHAESLGSAGILFTCSAFGAGIEAAAKQSPVTVLKPNEAMFEHAMNHGVDIVMLYSFPPALAGMSREFEEEALRRGGAPHLRPVFVPGALDALKAGDVIRHDRLIADAAAAVGSADAIMLAQFSMASAASLVREKTDVPILTSPDSAIEKLKAYVRISKAKGLVPC